MASENEVKFELNLDAAGFKTGVDAATQALKTLEGVSQGVKGAFSFIEELAVPLGILYASFKLLEGAVETVFDAERIKAVNAQFDALSANAGIASEKLRAGLEKSANGLISETELLKLSNQAIITMGHSAERLPEIMELARKATKAFGGDLASNFETLNQAIGTGQTRMLKHLGIVVDSDKAMAAYAISVGKSTKELTDAEQRQAIMNAALARGQVAFKGVTGDTTQAITTWKQFKVTIQEIVESLTLLFEKTVGGVVRSGLKTLAGSFKALSDILKANFGTAMEQAEAKIKSTDSAILNHQKNIERLTFLMANSPAYRSAEKQDELKRQIDEEKAKIGELKAKHDELAKAKEAELESKPAISVAAEPPDLKFAAARDAQEAQRIQNQEKLLELQQKYATDATVFDNAESVRKDMANERLGVEIQAIQFKAQAGVLNEQEAQNQIDQISAQHLQEREEMERTHAQRRMAIYENEVRKAQSTGQGIAAAFKQGSAQATTDMNNFGKNGQRVFGSFQQNSTNALMAFGAGTKTASEAAKGFLFGMLADEAQARGQLMMLASIWPPNPAGLAAGAGLVVLAGFLRSQADGGGKGGGGGASISAGGVGGNPYDSNDMGSPSIAQNEQQKKTVTVAIQGNYFDTDQTRMRLMEMIRETTDATDFKYVQIGGK